MKRVVSLALGLAMLLMCVSAYAEGMFPVTEEVTLKVAYVNRDDFTAFPDNPYFKIAEENTGVKIDWIEWNPTNAEQKMQLALASGDTPDIALFSHYLTFHVPEWAADGQLVCWDDYMEYAPNLSAVFEKRPDLLMRSRSTDGKLYYMPKIEENGIDSGSSFLVCMDWLEQAGCEVPTTFDEFKECLRAVKEVDYNGNGVADEIPFSLILGTPNLSWDSFIAMFGTSSNDHYWLLDDDQQIKFWPAMDEYKEALKFLNELYTEGLLDTEFATQTQAAYEAKINDPVPSICFTLYWGCDNVNNGGAQYTAIEPLEGPDGEKHWARRIIKFYVGAVVFNSCKNPEMAVAWLDSFATEEMTVQASYGLFGSLLNVTEDGYYVQYQNEDGSYPTGNQIGTESMVYGFTPLLIDYMEKFHNPTRSDKENCTAIYRPYLREDIYSFINFNLTDAENDTLAQYTTNITNYATQSIVNFIVNGGVDEGWDAYLETLDETGLGICLDTYQTAYNRYAGIE